MAIRFNKERAELSEKWQNEVVRFAKEILSNRNLNIPQIEMKKAEIDNLYDSFKDMPFFIEEEDL